MGFGEGRYEVRGAGTTRLSGLVLKWMAGGDAGCRERCGKRNG